MVDQPVRRVENAGQGGGGAGGAEGGRNRDAVQSGGKADEGAVNDTLNGREV